MPKIEKTFAQQINDRLVGDQAPVHLKACADKGALAVFDDSAIEVRINGDTAEVLLAGESRGVFTNVQDVENEVLAAHNEEGFQALMAMLGAGSPQLGALLEKDDEARI